MENPWVDEEIKIPLELPERIADGWTDNNQAQNEHKKENSVAATNIDCEFNEISLNDQQALANQGSSLKLMNIPLNETEMKSSEFGRSKSGRTSEKFESHLHSQEDLIEKLHNGLRGSRSVQDENGSKFTNKSQTLNDIQNIFTDAQKIAYVGLCFLAMNEPKSSLIERKNAIDSYEKWAQILMEKLYIYLELSAEERLMIESLAEHGLKAEDLSVTLLDDSKIDSIGAMDIRYTVLSHLFLISLCDGIYDSRSRNLLKLVAKHLKVSYEDVVTLEGYIADMLRIYEEDMEVRGNKEVIEIRNKREGTNRWIYAGAATLAGGAIIGLTAGLAAPFIGAGVGAALTTFGMTGSGVAGIGAFLSGTGGLALITSGGVLTGGGIDYL